MFKGKHIFYSLQTNRKQTTNVIYKLLIFFIFLEEITSASKILQKYLHRVFPVIYKTDLCNSLN